MHSGMYGMYALQESVRQMRGIAPAQVEGAKITVCHGVGGMFAASGTIIMSNEAPLTKGSGARLIIIDGKTHLCIIVVDWIVVYYGQTAPAHRAILRNIRAAGHCGLHFIVYFLCRPRDRDTQIHIQIDVEADLAPRRVSPSKIYVLVGVKGVN
jgi:hypothetical protein